MRQLLQGVTSQGLTALSSFAIVIAVARVSTPAEFGAFAIVYSVLQVMLAGIRASVGETLAVVDPEGGASRSAVGAGVALGCVTALVLALFGIGSSGLISSWFFAAGAALPVLAWQESERSAALATGRAEVATLNDFTWVVAISMGWAATATLSAARPTVLFVVWVAGAAAGALAASLRSGWPYIGGGVQWLRTNRRLGVDLGIDSVAAVGAGQASVYALGAVAGLPAAGALRAAESLYGPVRTVVLGTVAVSLPEAVSRARLNVAALWSFTRSVSAALVAFTLTGAAGLSLMPDALGSQLLGDTWRLAETVMLQMGIVAMGLAAGVGPRLGLRVLRRTRVVLRLRAITSVALLASGVGGALADGLTGAASGLAAAQLATAAWAWLVYRREAGATKRVT